MYLRRIPNGFRGTVLHCIVPNLLIRSCYILFLISNTDIHCSSDKVGTIYLLQCISELFAINIHALCNSREHMARCSSVQCTVKYLYLGNRSVSDIRTYTLFCLEWPILWPLRIMTSLSRTLYICLDLKRLVQAIIKETSLMQVIPKFQNFYYVWNYMWFCMHSEFWHGVL
jgi:hypothetical protein